jgi:3-oxoacyl-[acyl-carrier-protein] synthase-3
MNGEGPRWAHISGWGMYVPERVLTNADLARVVNTSDEWIVSHTGIRERHVVSDERETTATLAVRAARAALRVANLAPSQLDLVIVATSMPDFPFPTTACLVQDALGANRAGAFDLGAACSGFIYALNLATGFIRSGQADHVLVIGSETLSRMMDWSDRNTCVLFGDGAGAVVLSASSVRCGVLASELGSDGSGSELLIVRAGGSRAPASYDTVSNGDHFVWMNGREVYRFATTIMPKATESVVRKAGWQLSDLALVIPHQANIRIIDSSIKRLSLPREKFFVNLERYGNTSAASIPIALCEAVANERVHPGDKLVMVGFGAGLTWAAAAVEWGVPVPPRPEPWWRIATSFLFGWARIRSLIRRTVRHVSNWIVGPVGKDDFRGRVRRRADRLRTRNGK